MTRKQIPSATLVVVASDAAALPADIRKDLQAPWVTFKGVATRQALLQEALQSEVCPSTSGSNPDPNPKPNPNPDLTLTLTPTPTLTLTPNPITPQVFIYLPTAAETHHTLVVEMMMADQLILAQRFPSVQTLLDKERGVFLEQVRSK